KKINWSSFSTEFNSSTNTTKLNSSKILLDGTNQTLNVAFNEVNSKVNNIQVGGRNYYLDSANVNIINANDNIYTHFKLSSDFMKSIRNKPVTISAVFSADNISSVNGNGNFHFGVDICVTYTDDTVTWINLTRGKGGLPGGDGSINEKRYSYTTQILDKEVKALTNMGIFIRGYTTVRNFTIKDVKIEIGNKPTDWTPAPEDSQSQFDSHTTQLNIEKGRINTLIQDTTIVKDGQTVKLKDEYSKLEQTVSGINSTVGSQQTTINQHTGQITSTNTKVSQLEQSVNGLTSTVQETNTKVDNIQVGGRNLVKNSELNIVVDKNTNSTINKGFNIENPSILQGETITTSIFIKRSGEYVNLEGGYANRFGYHLNLTWEKEGTGETVKEYPQSDMLYKESENGTRIYAVYKIFKQGYILKTISVSIQAHCKPSSNNNVTWVMKEVKLEIGNKATDWTPAPEDINQSIDNVDKKITTTNNKLSQIEQNVNSITQRVSSVETTTSTINGNVTNLQVRMNTAEQKITDSSIINTVSKEYYKKGEADIKYSTKSEVIQTSENITFKFSNSSSSNMFSNGLFRTGDLSGWGLQQHNNPSARWSIINTSGLGGNPDWAFPSEDTNTFQVRMDNQDNKEFGLYKTIPTIIGKKYTISFYSSGHRVGNAMILVRNPDHSWHQWKDFNAGVKSGGRWSIDDWDYQTFTFTATNTYHVVNIILKQGFNNANWWVARVMCNEGEVALPYAAHSSEVYEANTVIDRNGLTVSNGAITVKNKAGQDMIKGDSDGNLMVMGKLYSDPNNPKLTLFNQCQIDATHNNGQGRGDKLRVKWDDYHYVSIMPYKFVWTSLHRNVVFDRDASEHLRIQHTNGTLLKMLNSTSQIQSRWWGDNGYGTFAGSDYVKFYNSREVITQKSKREHPILSYDVVKNSNPFIYLKDKALGISRNNLTKPINHIIIEGEKDEEGISIINTTETLWEAMQVLQAQNDALREEIDEIKRKLLEG
ncbi:MAG: hypothetical protein ACRC7N_14665, partial [Clostridium sp.]